MRSLTSFISSLLFLLFLLSACGGDGNGPPAGGHYERITIQVRSYDPPGMRIWVDDRPTDSYVEPEAAVSVEVWTDTGRQDHIVSLRAPKSGALVARTIPMSLHNGIVVDQLYRNLEGMWKESSYLNAPPREAWMIWEAEDVKPGGRFNVEGTYNFNELCPDTQVAFNWPSFGDMRRPLCQYPDDTFKRCAGPDKNGDGFPEPLHQSCRGDVAIGWIIKYKYKDYMGKAIFVQTSPQTDSGGVGFALIQTDTPPWLE